jgi:hypothetical protein
MPWPTGASVESIEQPWGSAKAEVMPSPTGVASIASIASTVYFMGFILGFHWSESRHCRTFTESAKAASTATEFAASNLEIFQLHGSTRGQNST